MENTINNRLVFLLKDIFKGNVSEFARVTGVPQPTLNNIVGNRMSKPSADNLERIINSIELLDANWLITGQGEMYKTNTAGRDNNIVDGDNKGVVGNTGTVGNVGGNHVSITDTSNLKKIIDGEKVSIEFAQSIDLMQQTNVHLQTRVNDLLAQLESKDALIKAKDDMIGLMQGLIGSKK